jgi:hypothetical protein
MWSSPLELYPVHLPPLQSVEGQTKVAEPQTAQRQTEYLTVQPTQQTYSTQEYSRRLWIC